MQLKIIVLVLFFIILCIYPVSAVTRYVNQSGLDNATTYNHTKIQWAINNSTQNDVIFIQDSAVYDENLDYLLEGLNLDLNGGHINVSNTLSNIYLRNSSIVIENGLIGNTQSCSGSAPDRCYGLNVVLGNNILFNNLTLFSSIKISSTTASNVSLKNSSFLLGRINTDSGSGGTRFYLNDTYCSNTLFVTPHSDNYVINNYADGRVASYLQDSGNPTSATTTVSSYSEAMLGQIGNPYIYTRLFWVQPNDSNIIYVKILSWGTTYRVWNESCTNSSAFVTHILSGYNASKYVRIYVNDSLWQTQQANSSGYITFVYNGGYSDIQFNLTEDLTPPASIISVANSTGNFWVNWTWTNPTDSDFNSTQIYVNDTFITNTTNNFYNGSFSAHAMRTISLRTEDTSGNINYTWTNQTTQIANNAPTAINITFNNTAPSLNSYIRAWANASDLDVVDTFNYDFVVLYPNSSVYSDPTWTANNYMDYYHDTTGSFTVYMRARDNRSDLSSATYLVNGSYYSVLNQTSVANTAPTKPYLNNPRILDSGIYYNHSKVLEVVNGTDADLDAVMTHVSINSTGYSRVGDLLSNATAVSNASYVNNSMTANWNTTYYLTTWSTDTRGGDSGDNTSLIRYNESLPTISLSIPADAQGLTSGEIVFQWTSSDSDSDILNYTLFISTDINFETGLQNYSYDTTTGTVTFSTVATYYWKVRVNDSIYTVNSSARSLIIQSSSGGGGGGGGGGSVTTIIQAAEPLKLDTQMVDTYLVLLSRNDTWQYYLKSNRVLKNTQVANDTTNWTAELPTEGLVKITYYPNFDNNLYKVVQQQITVVDQQGISSTVQVTLRCVDLTAGLGGIPWWVIWVALGFSLAVVFIGYVESKPLQFLITGFLFSGGVGLVVISLYQVVV